MCMIAYALLAPVAGACSEVVAVVSARSMVTELTVPQLTDIFLGRVSRFPNGEPAQPIDQVEGSAARDEFYARFAGRSPAQLKAHWSKLIFTGKGQPPRAVASTEKLRNAIADNPYAIGYLRRDEVDASLRIVKLKERP